MLHRHLGRRDYGGLVFGGILLFVGGFYLLRNTLGFDLGELDWEPIWPVLVILLGVAVVVGALTRREGGEPPS
jgi:hypothetical protein